MTLGTCRVCNVLARLSRLETEPITTARERSAPDISCYPLIRVVNLLSRLHLVKGAIGKVVVRDFPRHPIPPVQRQGALVKVTHDKDRDAQEEGRQPLGQHLIEGIDVLLAERVEEIPPEKVEEHAAGGDERNFLTADKASTCLRVVGSNMWYMPSDAVIALSNDTGLGCVIQSIFLPIHIHTGSTYITSRLFKNGRT